MHKLKKKEYTGIDLAKLMCAFLVVAIHTEPFRDYIWLDRGLGLFTRIPVPFFFIAAGFFLFLPGDISSKRLGRYVGRIAILYALWSLIYSPIFINGIASAESFGEALYYAIRTILLKGVSSHLWFLTANIFAVVLTWICYRKLSSKQTLAIATVLLIFGTLFSTYSPVTEKLIGGGYWLFSILDVIDTRNGLFYGFFYVSLGSWIATRKNDRSKKYYLIMFIVSFLALAAESTVGIIKIHVKSTIMWFSAPFMIYAFFMLTKLTEIKVTSEQGLKIRNVSTLIYTSQFVWIFLLSWIGLPEHGLSIFFGTSIIAVIFSLVVIRLTQKLEWLHYIY